MLLRQTAQVTKYYITSNKGCGWISVGLRCSTAILLLIDIPSTLLSCISPIHRAPLTTRYHQGKIWKYSSHKRHVIRTARRRSTERYQSRILYHMKASMTPQHRRAAFTLSCLFPSSKLFQPGPSTSTSAMPFGSSFICLIEIEITSMLTSTILVCPTTRP